jgi:hypothetical protein
MASIRLPGSELKMSRSAWILLALLLPAAEAIAASAPSDMPDTLFASWSSVPGRRWSEYPIWVKADAALDAQGQPRAELFPPQSRETLSYYLALPATNGCIEILPLPDESSNPPQRGDLRTGVTTSQLVFLAEVTDRAAGFQRSDPGTLLRLRPTEVFKSEDGPALAEYFLFVPKGTVRAGAKTLCKLEPGYAEVPSVGDDVLVFVQRDWIDTAKEPYLRTYGDGGAMISLHGDTVSAPALYAGTAKSLATRRAVVDQVRALTAPPGR